MMQARSADMFRHLLYPFLPYRSFAVPMIVVSAIAIPCWVVFRLYRLLRCRDYGGS